jgi:hypothetical protein
MVFYKNKIKNELGRNKILSGFFVKKYRMRAGMNVGKQTPLEKSWKNE